MKRKLIIILTVLICSIAICGMFTTYVLAKKNNNLQIELQENVDKLMTLQIEYENAMNDKTSLTATNSALALKNNELTQENKNLLQTVESLRQDLDSATNKTAKQKVETASTSWNGSVLTPSGGVNSGPSGKETYYNLPMDGVVSIMRGIGNTDEYWVRDDGVKMLGDYVMVAANLDIRPRGSLIETSLGMGIVCDTGGFAAKNPTQLDIAVNW